MIAAATQAAIGQRCKRRRPRPGAGMIGFLAKIALRPAQADRADIPELRADVRANGMKLQERIARKP
jgi:hypothetical protein